MHEEWRCRLAQALIIDAQLSIHIVAKHEYVALLRNEPAVRGTTSHRLNQYLEAQSLWQIECALGRFRVFVDAVTQLASIVVTPREELRVAPALGRRHVLVFFGLVVLIRFIMARSSDMSVIAMEVAARVVFSHRRSR